MTAGGGLQKRCMETAHTGQARVRSPILRGFNPDPSVCRVGGEHRLDFTGTFVGLCCNELTGARKPADFDSFTLRGRS